MVWMMPASPAADHSAWNTMLSKHVTATGKVKYKGFQKDKPALEAYCQYLSSHPPQADWSSDEKKAFWINAYNAFTIKLITDNYPVASIEKLDNGKPWDVKRIPIGDQTYSLNQIENDILRPQFHDPRIHFAINCAARSCPPLLNKAFTAQNIGQILEERTRKFINDPFFNQITPEKAQLSKIFEWYGADFGDLRLFLNRYSTVKLTDQTAIRFNEYNWELNQ
jgi:hypothetical protein